MPVGRCHERRVIVVPNGWSRLVFTRARPASSVSPSSETVVCDRVRAGRARPTGPRGATRYARRLRSNGGENGVRNDSSGPGPRKSRGRAWRSRKRKPPRLARRRVTVHGDRGVARARKPFRRRKTQSRSSDPRRRVRRTVFVPCFAVGVLSFFKPLRPGFILYYTRVRHRSIEDSRYAKLVRSRNRLEIVSIRIRLVRIGRTTRRFGYGL